MGDPRKAILGTWKAYEESGRWVLSTLDVVRRLPYNSEASQEAYENGAHES
jgi:hypothetical protein